MAAPFPPPPADRGGFRVAIVCALKLEADAICLLFDETYERPYGRVAGDNNHYTTGRIGSHAVVLLLLPDMGARSAASSAAALRIAYPNLELALIVGVCGGLPRIGGHDAFLGDVVVSKSVCNYDFGRQYPDRFVTKTAVEDTLGRAGRNVRGFLASLETEHQSDLLQRAAAGNLASLQAAAERRRRRTNYDAPHRSSDRIFPADYPHKHHLGDCEACAAGALCEEADGLSCVTVGCDEAKLVLRRDGRPPESVPRIFMGKVASGNAVLKSGKLRDEMARLYGVVAFEMEGAGTWDEVPSIVVKGICDYADSHNKAWQHFAAATAAAVAAAMLGRYEDRNGFNFAAPLSPAPEPKANRHWLVPRAGHPLFTGRSELIGKIESAIIPNEEKGIKTFVLTGLAGQGKSEVCLQIVNRVRHRFWGVFWVDVSTDELARSGFSDISTLLELPGSVHIVEQVKRTLAGIGPDKDWLLVLDNADDEQTDYANKYLPPGEHGAVLVTSRLRSCAALERVGWEDLDGMDTADCVKLLLRAARLQNNEPGSRQAAEEVVELLGRHTLAVVLAGVYVQLGCCSLTEYPGMAKENLWELLNFSPQQSRSRYGSLENTFDASIAKLEHSGDCQKTDAYQIMQIMASMDHNELPLDLLEDAFSGLERAKDVPEDDSRINTLTRRHVGMLQLPFLTEPSSAKSFRKRLDRAVSRLKSMGFLVRERATGFEVVSLHTLVHKWLGARLRKEQRSRYSKTTAVVLALAQFNSGSETRPCHARIEANMQCLFKERRWLANPKKPSRPELQMAFQGCYFVMQLPNNRATQELFDQLTSKLWEHMVGSGFEEESDEETGSEVEIPALTADLALVSLRGKALRRVGKTAESLRVLERASRAANYLPKGDKDRLDFEVQLVLANGANKRFGAEIEDLEHVLQVLAPAGGLRHPTLSHIHRRVMNLLAVAYVDDGRFGEAVVEFCRRLVDEKAQRYHSTDARLLAARMQLARACFCDRQFEAAVEEFRVITELQEQSVGKDHAYTVGTKYNLAKACFAVGQLREAVDLLREVDRVMTALYEADNPLLLKTKRLLDEARKRLHQPGAGTPRARAAAPAPAATRAHKVAEDA